MNNFPFTKVLNQWIQLLRWNKPSGRLILLIPAGWTLWLAPSAPPQVELIILMISGGLFVSGAGCIANDLWDRQIDRKVARTSQRPLALGTIRIQTAIGLLVSMLLLSLLVIFLLPANSQILCLHLALMALPPILIYPSAKRWFAYPQAILSVCWGFAVLIPWAASESNLNITLTLMCTWGATLFWTFGFDTVYAMADSADDEKLGLKSSVLTLKGKVKNIVAFSYAITCVLIAIAAFSSGIKWSFWPIFLLTTLGMQRETWSLNKLNSPISTYSRHFQGQVFLGGLLLLGLILGRMS